MEDFTALDEEIHPSLRLYENDSDHPAIPTETPVALAENALLALKYESAPPVEAAPVNSVKLVPYTHGSRPQRLGRPRPAFPSAPPEDSVTNRDELKVSMFRFDRQPVVGPGSRGGRVSRPARGIITKIRGGSRDSEALNETRFDGKVDEKVAKLENTQSDAQDGDQMASVPDGTIIDATVDAALEGSIKAATEVSTASVPEVIQSEELNIPTNGTQTQHENPVKTSSSGRPLKQAKLDFPRASSPKSSPKKRLPAKRTGKTKLTIFIPKQSRGVSRTTVPNTLNKVTRQLPGPLVGLGYNLYDELHFDDVASSESLAFGFEVKPAPYAGDIMVIIEFLLKFRDIVGIDVGPQDLEEGLLGDSISPLATRVVLVLLELVLNRKRAITSLASAILELKPLAANLGFPKEWKEQILPTATLATEYEVLDPNHPDILPGSLFPTYQATATYNPFGPVFEREGLLCLEPADRFVFVRTLCQWALSSSELIKSRITAMIHGQDIPGDKETHYVARSVLNGVANTLEAKKQAESKLAKREDDVKYVDPTSDPMKHCFRLRLDELVVGDCGFHLGRFYLCKMGGVSSGGLGSVAQMKAAHTKTSKSGTRFKVYVQDIHQMLVSLLREFGVEFTPSGEEVQAEIVNSEEWYEVALDIELLNKFITHLETKIPLLKKSLTNIPVKNMHAHLSSLVPVLERPAELVEEIPEKRSRRMTYDDGTQFAEVFEEYQPDYIVEDADDGEYIDQT